MARLNQFQLLMLSWSAYQPFLIVEAMEIDPSIDTASYADSAERELTQAGVAWPKIDRQCEITYQSKPVQLSVHDYQLFQDESLQEGLERIAATELNRPIQINIDPLIRLWRLKTQKTQILGCSFQHFAADGYAAADLFRRILARTVQQTDASIPSINQHNPIHSARLFAPWRRLKRIPAYLHDAIRESFRSSKIFCPPRVNPDQTSLQTRIIDLPEDVLLLIQATAKEYQATINDVLASALIWSVAQHTNERYRSDRNRLSITNIVDLRRDLGSAVSKQWGSFLGLALIHLFDPIPRNWQAVIPPLREQSHSIKSKKLYFGSLFAFWLTRTIWDVLPQSMKWSWSGKVIRSSMALSNSRMPDEWFENDWDGKLGRYWRFGPLGSLVPLFGVATTKNQDLRLTLTCERDGMIAEKFPAICDQLQDCLSFREVQPSTNTPLPDRTVLSSRSPLVIQQ